MVDFSQLLRKPAGMAKPPKALPIGDYPALLKAWEVGDQNRNHTPYVRWQLVLVSWPDTVPEHERDGIELSKRALRKDFYLTEDSAWRLDKFIRSCGVDIDENNPRTYEEILPSMVGKPVIVQVQQYINQQTNDVGNTAGEVVGM